MLTDIYSGDVLLLCPRVSLPPSITTKTVGPSVANLVPLLQPLPPNIETDAINICNNDLGQKNRIESGCLV